MAGTVIVAAMTPVSQVLLLLFGAVLFAVLLDAPARLLERRLRVPHAPGVSLVLLLLVIGLVVWRWRGEPRIAHEVGALPDRLPEDARRLQDELERSPWAHPLIEGADWQRRHFTSPSALLARVSGIFSGTLGAMVNLGLMLVVGFYLVSWVVTLPAGAVLSVIFFFALQRAFG